MKTFYISDLHLYHNNVIKMCNRPYEDLEEMNKDFVHKWNSAVTEEDKAMILGDVGFPRNQEEIKAIINTIKQLNGKKYLVIGNHDYKLVKNEKFRSLFEEMEYYMRIRDNDRLVILSHYPMEEWDGLYRGSYHLFGHVHNKDQHLLKLNNRFNVCTDVIGFTPRTLDELIEMGQNDKLTVALYEKIVKGFKKNLSEEILNKIVYTSLPEEGDYDDLEVIRVHLSEVIDMDEMGCILMSVRKSGKALGYSKSYKIMVDFFYA